MPAAAAGPDRNSVGMLQSGGFAEEMPILTSVSATSTVTTPVASPANASPAAASRQASTTCQVRSPVRSECRAHSTMATTAALAGNALRNPTWSVDRPNCLMICGAQTPSV
ncbi:hypothetical protein ACVWZZ_001687 [Bradyrhizobium sp. LM6.10]